MSKRLPDSVKEQRGTLRKVRVNKNKLTGSDAIPMPPATLPEAAHQIWLVAVSALANAKVFNPAFEPLLEIFCHEKLKYDTAIKAMYDDGEMTDYTNDGKTKIVSLYIRIQNDALSNMMDISKRFGFDLLSMEAIGSRGEEKKDPFEDEL